MELINQLKTIDKTNIIDVIEYLSLQKDIQQLKKLLGNEKSNNGYGTTFISPQNKLFGSIYIHSDENNISVGLSGNFNLEFETLLSIFGQFREVYVPYDDHYMCFFNENKRLGNYILSTYSKNGRKNLNNWIIKNICLRYFR